MLLILSLIYTSKISDAITITLLEVTSILLMDDLRSLTSENSIKKVVTSLETTEKTDLR